MTTIRISKEVFEGLKQLAEPFVDTPNDVIQRLLEEKKVIKPVDMDLDQMQHDHVSKPKEPNLDIKSSVRFKFIINKSFLEQSNHPITIPKDYHQSLKINGITMGILGHKEHTEISVINTDGNLYHGKLYFAESAGGDYYQILIPKVNARGYCSNLRLNETIEVMLWKEEKRAKAQLIKKSH